MENQNQNTFIGKGKKNESGKIVVTLNMDEAEKFFSTFKGKKYLQVHIVEMKKPDNYGRTMTAYTFPPTEEAPEAQN